MHTHFMHLTFQKTIFDTPHSMFQLVIIRKHKKSSWLKKNPISNWFRPQIYTYTYNHCNCKKYLLINKDFMLKNSIKITRVKGSTGICKKTQFKLVMRNKGQEFNLAQKSSCYKLWKWWFCKNHQTNRWYTEIISLNISKQL